MADTPIVSVIIPVFNCEEYLARCLDSVFDQTFQDFEVIAVNDGSTDGCFAILNEYADKYPQMRVLDQANAGQGAARNRAIGEALGEYVLFVDADDFIESVLLQVTVERAEKDQSDFVHFDWKLYKPSPDRKSPYLYYNVDPFWHNYTLQGAQCDELLRVKNQFSVTNLYRRSFLNTHGIRFEEGRIYEDNPFVVHAVNRAELVSLVHSPLYTVNPHTESTTRRDTGTEKHYRDHIFAIRRSFDLLQHRSPNAAVYVAAYHVKKFGPYYETRIPRKYRSAYVRAFVDVIHEAQVPSSEGISTNAPYRFVTKHRVMEDRRYAFFQAFTVAKNLALPPLKRAKSKLRYVKRRMKSDHTLHPRVRRALKREPVPGLICFLGFDARYTGNSKALFEQIRNDERFVDADIRFVTSDDRIPEKMRVRPASREMHEIIASASVVIAETWVDPNIQGNIRGKWVQLWHGTPIKRMLFDSHEPDIISKRLNHKINKYRDIIRWDVLLIDEESSLKLFTSAFLIEKKRILALGYPRVEVLKRLRKNPDELIKVRRELGVRETSKVMLYAPTWRDYNYQKKQTDWDMSYLLDVNLISEQLGQEWFVIKHDHHYQTIQDNGKIKPDNSKNVIDGSQTEVELLLGISDILVTDYSSILFDAISVNIATMIVANDIEKYCNSRGIYPHDWDNRVYDLDDFMNRVNILFRKEKNMKDIRTHEQRDKNHVVLSPNIKVEDMNGKCAEMILSILCEQGK